MSAAQFPARTGAVPVLAAGAALMVARYVLLPLDLEPSWLRTLSTVVPVALIVTGIMWLRQGTGVIRWALAARGALVGAGVGVGAVLLVARALGLGGLDEVALEPVEVPGLVTAMPDWPQERHAGAAAGMVVRKRADGRAEVRLEFGVQPAIGADEAGALIAETLSAMGPIGDRQRAQMATADGPVDAVAVAMERPVVTTWLSNYACPAGPTVSISTVAKGSVDAVGALHRRVLAETRCVAETAPAKGAAPRARFETPEGFTRVEDGPDGVMYADEAAGEVMMLYPPSPNLALAEQLEGAAPVREALVGMFVAEQRALPRPAPRTVDGVERRFWAFAGKDAESGEAVRGVLAAWPCATAGVTLSGVWISYGAAGPDRGAALLAGARCP